MFVCQLKIEEPLLRSLQAHGFVEPLSSGGLAMWRLTVEGMKTLMSVMVLGQHRHVYEVREGVMLEDRTTFELIKTLQNAGWTWRKWQPPSRRSAEFSIAYVPGGEKVWSSSMDVSRNYLLLMTQHQVAFANIQFESLLQSLPFVINIATYCLPMSPRTQLGVLVCFNMSQIGIARIPIVTLLVDVDVC
jgi:hypothetical protein